MPSSFLRRTTYHCCNCLGQVALTSIALKMRSKGETTQRGRLRSSPTDQPHVPLMEVVLARLRAAFQSSNCISPKGCSGTLGIVSNISFQGVPLSKPASRCQYDFQPLKKARDQTLGSRETSTFSSSAASFRDNLTSTWIESSWTSKIVHSLYPCSLSPSRNSEAFNSLNHCFPSGNHLWGANLTVVLTLISITGGCCCSLSILKAKLPPCFFQESSTCAKKHSRLVAQHLLATSCAWVAAA